jgi:hypothetical protein
MKTKWSKIFEKEINSAREEFELKAVTDDSEAVFVKVTKNKKEYSIMAIPKMDNDIIPDIVICEGKNSKVVYSTSKLFPIGSTEDNYIDFI